MKRMKKILSVILTVVILTGIMVPMCAFADTQIDSLNFKYLPENGKVLELDVDDNLVELLQCKWTRSDSNAYFNGGTVANKNYQYELFFQVVPVSGKSIKSGLTDCYFNGVKLNKNAALPIGSFRQMGDNSVQLRVKFSYLDIVDKNGKNVDRSNITGFHINGEKLPFTNIDSYNDNGHFSSYSVSGDALLKFTNKVVNNQVTMGSNPSTITANFVNHSVYKIVIEKAGIEKYGSFKYACHTCAFADTESERLIPAVEMEYEGFEEHGASSKTLYYNGKNQTLGVDLYFNGSPLSSDEYSIQFPESSYKVGKYTAKVSVFGEYFEDSITYTYNIYLGKPKVSAKVSTSAVKLSWAKVPGATKYRVYGYNLSTGKYKQIVETKNLSYTRTGRKSGTAYAYLVRAVYVNKQGKEAAVSPYTKADNVNVVTLCAAPKVTASVSGKTVTLKWAKVSSVKFYRVYEYNAKTKKYTTVLKSTTKLSVKLKNQKKGTHYYLVRAFNKAAVGSAYSTKNLAKATVR